MRLGVPGLQTFQEQAIEVLQTFLSEEISEGEAVVQRQYGWRFRSGHENSISGFQGRLSAG